MTDKLRDAAFKKFNALANKFAAVMALEVRPREVSRMINGMTEVIPH